MTLFRFQGLTGLVVIGLVGCSTEEHGPAAPSRDVDSLVPPKVGIVDGRAPLRPSPPTDGVTDTIDGRETAEAEPGIESATAMTESESGAESDTQANSSLRRTFEFIASWRFKNLERDLMLLETKVFREELLDEMAQTMAHLHRLRNEAALALAELETASDDVFPNEQEELRIVLDSLGAELEKVSNAVDKRVERQSSALVFFKSFLR